MRRFKTKFRNDDEWEEYAADLLGGPAADVFARALDRMGWMIVRQPQYADGTRWPMGSKPCPSWTNDEWANGFFDDGPEVVFEILDQRKPPQLRIIDGDKKDDT
jgi:hypothetical protein